MDLKNLNGIDYLRYSNKIEKCKREKFKKPDPYYDAWCMVSAFSRDTFDVKSFLESYPYARAQLKHLREKCNVNLTDRF